MKRAIVLGTLLVVGGLSLGVLSAQAPAGPSAAALGNTKIEKVKDNLYVITGSGADDQAAFSGGNSAVFITDAGVVLVDTKLPGWGPTVLERIRSVTDKPVTTIINTHTHEDHTGSNEFFGTPVTSVVHENTRANMEKMDAFKGENAKFLPKRTYKDRMTLGAGKDRVDLYYFGAGHTSGDTLVVFPALRTMHTGDLFAWKGLPYTDASTGGSPVAHAQTLAKAVATIKGVDTVITGHIPVQTWNDFKEYAEFSGDFMTFARAALKAGKTVEQAASEYKVPSRFTGYVVSPVPQFVSATSNLQLAYNELKK